MLTDFVLCVLSSIFLNLIIHYLSFSCLQDLSENWRFSFVLLKCFRFVIDWELWDEWRSSEQMETIGAKRPKALKIWMWWIKFEWLQFLHEWNFLTPSVFSYADLVRKAQVWIILKIAATHTHAVWFETFFDFPKDLKRFRFNHSFLGCLPEWTNKS